MEPTAIIARIIGNIERVIQGKRDTIAEAVAVFLAGGHLLIEDMPGLGKTMLARALARSCDLDFKRIQFTPDLLPGDITGTTLYDQKTQEFRFIPGPVFAGIVLADEINRATPRTQAAMLECMGEGRVSADGVVHPLPDPFFVIATQNPIETLGTFPLPVAELDRFMARIAIGYPDPASERAMLTAQERLHPIETLTPVLAAGALRELRRGAASVRMTDELKDYLVRIVNASRRRPGLALGASPRAALDVMKLARARAFLGGREFVAPDELKAAARLGLPHRLVTARAGSGAEAGAIVEELLADVAAPG